MHLHTLTNAELANVAERDPRNDTDPMFAELVARLRDRERGSAPREHLPVVVRVGSMREEYFDVR